MSAGDSSEKTPSSSAERDSINAKKVEPAAIGLLPPLVAGTVPSFPRLHINPFGSVSILLKHEVIVEVAVDRSLRIVCPGKFAVASNGRGSSSSVNHSKVKVTQIDARVCCEFEGTKLAVFGSQGVLFTMRPYHSAYLVSSANATGANISNNMMLGGGNASTFACGTTSLPAAEIEWPNLHVDDATLRLFYKGSPLGEPMVPMCEDLVKRAVYRVQSDGQLVVNINNMHIRQDNEGTVTVNNRPRFIQVSPHTGFIHLRTHFVDIGIEGGSKYFVKRGVKRVHVSRSGMVVSDGNRITSMDHVGTIVASS